MEQVPNLYDQLVGGFWKHRQGLEDMRQKNLNFETDYAREQMKIPEDVAKSKLATMTAESDMRLNPMQTEVKAQELDDEYKFNVLKDMRELMDANDIDDNEKQEMFRRGALKLMGVQGQPTLKDSQAVARAQYVLESIRQNPEKARQLLDDRMSTLARSFKSTNQQDLARTKGNIQHTNTQLKANADMERARFQAMYGEKWAKNWGEYATREMQNAIKRGDMAGAQYWSEQSKEYGLAGKMQAGLAQGERWTADVAPDGKGLQVGKMPTHKVDKPDMSKASKNQGPMSTKQSITIGGQTFNNFKVLPDGKVEVTLPDGSVRRAGPQ